MTAPVRADQDAELDDLLATLREGPGCDCDECVGGCHVRQLEALAAHTIATLRAERDQLAADLREAREERDKARATGREAEARRQKNQSDWSESFRQLSDAWQHEIRENNANLVDLAKMYGEACAELAGERATSLDWLAENLDYSEQIYQWQRQATAAEAAVRERDAEIAALRSPQGDGAEAMRGMVVQAGQLQDHIDDLEEALYRIQQWSDAYPLTVFPEPDLKKARALLEAGGVTLDSISAYCMRHVVEGVGRIAKAALAHPDPRQPEDTSKGSDRA